MKDIGRILERHYLAHDPAIAVAAVRRLEEYITSTQAVNRV